jgi:hypothetical protein
MTLGNMRDVGVQRLIGSESRLDQGEEPGCAGRDEADRRLTPAVLAYPVLLGGMDEAARLIDQGH